jgi:hypothetical protein
MTYWLTIESPLTGRMVSMEIHSSEERIKGYLLLIDTRPRDEVPPITEVFPNLPPWEKEFISTGVSSSEVDEMERRKDNKNNPEEDKKKKEGMKWITSWFG